MECHFSTGILPRKRWVRCLDIDWWELQSDNWDLGPSHDFLVCPMVVSRIYLSFWRVNNVYFIIADTARQWSHKLQCWPVTEVSLRIQFTSPRSTSLQRNGLPKSSRSKAFQSSLSRSKLTFIIIYNLYSFCFKIIVAKISPSTMEKDTQDHCLTSS